MCSTFLSHYLLFKRPLTLRILGGRFWEIFSCGMQNQRTFYSWNPEFSILELAIQLKESGIPLTIGIRNPSSTDKDSNPALGIRNSGRGIQNPRLYRIPLHGARRVKWKKKCAPQIQTLGFHGNKRFRYLVVTVI